MAFIIMTGSSEDVAFATLSRRDYNARDPFLLTFEFEPEPGIRFPFNHGEIRFEEFKRRYQKDGRGAGKFCGFSFMASMLCSKLSLLAFTVNGVIYFDIHGVFRSGSFEISDPKIFAKLASAIYQQEVPPGKFAEELQMQRSSKPAEAVGSRKKVRIQLTADEVQRLGKTSDLRKPKGSRERGGRFS